MDKQYLSQLAKDMLEALDHERASTGLELGVLKDLAEVKIENGVRRISEPGAYHYQFGCKIKQTIPSDTPVQVATPAESVSGEVFDHDPEVQRLELVLGNDLGREVAAGTLSFDTSRLLDMLGDRIRTIVGSPETFQVQRALQLLDGKGPVYPPASVTREGLNSSQLRAIGMMLANDVSYIWGPPGTGKTRTVAHMVSELVERGDRVLLTAHTNITHLWVRTGRTGHAEAVQVVFDPTRVSYDEVLRYFFRLHDPTTKNRQGNDVGTQYRSAIFYHDDTQRRAALRVKKQVNRSGKWKNPVVTRIVAHRAFHKAEAYHQDYLQKKPNGYTCHYLRD